MRLPRSTSAVLVGVSGLPVLLNDVVGVIGSGGESGSSTVSMM